jgi:hypothetical protein
MRNDNIRRGGGLQATAPILRIGSFADYHLIQHAARLIPQYPYAAGTK